MNVQPKVMTFETRLGKRIFARPLTVYDAPNLVNIFDHMSDESRYRRFLTPLADAKTEMVWQEANRIVWMDEDEQAGLLAFWQRPLLPDIPVGAARYVFINETTAEIAMSVRDDMQGQGVGTWLLRLTMEQAAENGLLLLVGTVQNENEAIWRVLNRMPFPLTRKADGTTSEVEIDLTQRKG